MDDQVRRDGEWSEKQKRNNRELTKMLSWENKTIENKISKLKSIGSLSALVELTGWQQEGTVG